MHSAVTNTGERGNRIVIAIVVAQCVLIHTDKLLTHTTQLLTAYSHPSFIHPPPTPPLSLNSVSMPQAGYFLKREDSPWWTLVDVHITTPANFLAEKSRLLIPPLIGLFPSSRLPLSPSLSIIPLCTRLSIDPVLASKPANYLRPQLITFTLIHGIPAVEGGRAEEAEARPKKSFSRYHSLREPPPETL